MYDAADGDCGNDGDCENYCDDGDNHDYHRGDSDDDGVVSRDENAILVSQAGGKQTF